MSFLDSIKVLLKIGDSLGTIDVSKLSYSDKERIMVQRITMNDMRKFTNFPFKWTNRIKKIITRNTHPFAYMDLCRQNIDIAKVELQKLSDIISASHELSPVIPSDLCIPVNDIVFNPSCKHGYSKIKCSPYTINGSESEYPASIYFTTDLNSISSTTHGELFYNRDGEFGKAQIYFWRNGTGYFFYFCTVNNVFTLSKVESTNISEPYTPPYTIYKGKHILELEAKRKKDEMDYIWLQSHIPEKCPKSLTGFRRMKTQNTKNYQNLKQLASSLGREI